MLKEYHTIKEVVGPLMLVEGVSGVTYRIRRGVEVEVPPEVAEVLEHSQMQDELTAARIAAAENAAQ